jgi:phenolic acid decarboxylase
MWLCLSPYWLLTSCRCNTVLFSSAKTTHFSLFIILPFLDYCMPAIGSAEYRIHVTMRLHTLLDWQSSGVWLYYTLSLLPAKWTWEEPTYTSSALPEHPKMYLYNIAFFWTESVLKHISAHTVSHTVHFIPLLVYSKDKKPAFHHHSI